MIHWPYCSPARSWGCLVCRSGRSLPRISDFLSGRHISLTKSADVAVFGLQSVSEINKKQTNPSSVGVFPCWGKKYKDRYLVKYELIHSILIYLDWRQISICSTDARFCDARIYTWVFIPRQQSLKCCHPAWAMNLVVAAKHRGLALPSALDLGLEVRPAST